MLYPLARVVVVVKDASFCRSMLGGWASTRATAIYDAYGVIGDVTGGGESNSEWRRKLLFNKRSGSREDEVISGGSHPSTSASYQAVREYF